VIFCDECGQTGNNLSDREQPYFSYSSINMGSDEASAIVNELRRTYRIQTDELKGRKLLKHNTGRKLITSLLNRCLPSSKSLVSNKKFALSCKLFEHIFEPVLANNNYLFYSVGFHKFVSNVLYLETVAKWRFAEEMLQHFQDMMKSKDSTGLVSFFAGQDRKSKKRTISEQIAKFAIAHRSAIDEELSSLSGAALTRRWTLDLTTTSLDGLLSYWGESNTSLDVICDDSPPLRDGAGIFNRFFLNNAAHKKKRKRRFLEIEGRRSLLNYELGRPLRLGNSKVEAGLQLADVIATALVECFENRRAQHSREWGAAFIGADAILDGGNIMPEPEAADLRLPNVMVNALLLQELIRRTEKGLDLLDGLGSYVAGLYSRMPGISAPNFIRITDENGNVRSVSRAKSKK